jgi:hypothetical protein
MAAWRRAASAACGQMPVSISRVSGVCCGTSVFALIVLR